MDKSFWDLTDAGAFVGGLLDVLEEERRDATISPLGEAILDVLDLDARIAMEGFADIFYQMLTAERCRVVHRTLADMQLLALASLFDEAFTIYCRGNRDISAAEFEKLEPFSLDGEAAERFDEIAVLFQAPGSGFDRICEATRDLALRRRAEIE